MMQRAGSVAADSSDEKLAEEVSARSESFEIMTTAKSAPKAVNFPSETNFERLKVSKPRRSLGAGRNRTATDLSSRKR